MSARPDPMTTRGGKVPVSQSTGLLRPPPGGSKPHVVTDRDALLGVLERFGVTPHTPDPSDRGDGLLSVELHGDDWDEQRNGQKVIGYTGFFCEFVFDQDGRFVRIGVWE